MKIRQKRRKHGAGDRDGVEEDRGQDAAAVGEGGSHIGGRVHVVVQDWKKWVIDHRSRSRRPRGGCVGGEEAAEAEGHAHRSRSGGVAGRSGEERDEAGSLCRMVQARDTWDQGGGLEVPFASEQSQVLQARACWYKGACC